ncbi:cfb733a6-9561-4d8c-aeee-b2ed9f917f9c-CDS [Sclerotinia trifoliorum]|uniref:Cfb733a6-9561-4d8c-aeee-b2ed9f917f9c-CDS n=1 Tax=Sclerotinia trifoliorum TaxID=28548 RepID=A0A8H2VQI1_9HELO|nr:cfb733a6-9561-4d8c-aeee-b2ed9f917f9c-CDS [Sclerotinia trifoliorum]
MLENFTCFPRLSPELRLKIQRTIAFMPRVVALWEQARHDGNTRQQISIQTTNAAAKLLQINHESRVEGLRSISLLVIYANLTADTVYFDRFCYQVPYMWTICSLLKYSPNMKEVLLVVRINDNLINRTISKFDEGEASGYREKYRRYWTRICDALGSRFTDLSKVVTFSDPKIKIVGWTRGGVRI